MRPYTFASLIDVVSACYSKRTIQPAQSVSVEQEKEMAIQPSPDGDAE